jgi:chromosome segregation ATPase
MSSLHRLLPALAAALLAASAPHVLAQAKTKTLGSGKPQGPLILSRAELRECLALQTRVKTKREEAEQVKEQLEKEKDELKRSGDELKDKLAVLDRTSQEQVDQYNAQAGERDKRIDAYQARTATFNAQVDALNAERESWSKNCENRRYDEKDELAIKMGK